LTPKNTGVKAFIYPCNTWINFLRIRKEYSLTFKRLHTVDYLHTEEHRQSDHYLEAPVRVERQVFFYGLYEEDKDYQPGNIGCDSADTIAFSAVSGVYACSKNAVCG